MAKWQPKETCDHPDWRYERGMGGSTGDLQCRRCGATFAPDEPQSLKWLAEHENRDEDAVQAARRVVDEATGEKLK